MPKAELFLISTLITYATMVMEVLPKRRHLSETFAAYNSGSRGLSTVTRTSDVMSKQTPWPESASELYRQSDILLSAQLVPSYADRRCHVVNADATSTLRKG
jgi:hypothetical protein